MGNGGDIGQTVRIKHIEELIFVFCLVICLLSIGGKI